jgi:hypothetical protein
MQPVPECPERNRLAQKVADSIAAVYDLKDRQRDDSKKNDTAVSVQLDQARTAERDAERVLRDHIEKHGCGR